MSNDKLWTLTVVAALSSLLILTYFLLSPMLNEESTAHQIEGGLGTTIAKFDSIRNEEINKSLRDSDSGT